MPDQYAVAVQQRAALLRGDRQVSRAVLDAYYKAWQSISERLGVLTTQLQEARAAGVEPSAGWLYEQDRLLSLQRQVAAEVSTVASRLAPFLTGEQARWVEQARRDTAALVQAGTVGTATGGSPLPLLHPAAIENVIGFVSDGSPLYTLLQELGPDAAKRVGDALVQGVALGQSPRQIARTVRTAFSGNLARALLISRDAVIRSYQESAHQQYLANADTLSGWRWLAAHSPRTCPSCLAMSGTLHPLTERLREHPGGRCTPIPEVRDNPAPFGHTGADWFDAQPDAVQREIVGPKKFEALSKGLINLEDLTIKRRSQRWGSHRGEATYAEALKNAAARTAGQPPVPVVSSPLPVPADAGPGKALRFALRDKAEAEDLRERDARRKETAAVDRFTAAADALFAFANSPAYLAAPYNDPVFEAKFERLKAVMQKTELAAQKAQAAQDRVRAGRLKVMRDALIPPPVSTPTQQLSVTVAPERGSTWTTEERKGIKTGAAFLDSVLQWGTHEGQLPYVRFREVPAGQEQRSYNLNGDVYLGAGDARSRAHHRSIATVVHELGHTLEHASLSVQQERVAFLKRRTQGDALEPMKALYPNSNYKDTEYTRKDKFKDAYTGVDYDYHGPVALTGPMVRDASGNLVSPPASITNIGGHPRYSEVISMGVQHLYEDPEAFARDDPDFFDFIIGILRRP